MLEALSSERHRIPENPLGPKITGRRSCDGFYARQKQTKKALWELDNICRSAAPGLLPHKQHRAGSSLGKGRATPKTWSAKQQSGFTK
jgi:hypothetical protein